MGSDPAGAARDTSERAASAHAKRELASVARLLGRLLVRELDAATVDALRAREVADAVRAVGIDLPEAVDLDALAAEYFAVFLRPETSLPPVQSLWEEGEYEGRAANALRTLARQAGMEPGEDSGHQPPDHLGRILSLWGECIDTQPEVAAELERTHLAWTRLALASPATSTGFYGGVARATLDFLSELGA